MRSESALSDRCLKDCNSACNLAMSCLYCLSFLSFDNWSEEICCSNALFSAPVTPISDWRVTKKVEVYSVFSDTHPSYSINEEIYKWAILQIDYSLILLCISFFSSSMRACFWAHSLLRSPFSRLCLSNSNCNLFVVSHCTPSSVVSCSICWVYLLSTALLSSDILRL